MVLRGDLHPAGPLVEHRLIGPPMAELELERLGRRRPGREAGGPGRCRRSGASRLGGRPDQRPKCRDRFSASAGVAGAVGEEDAVGLVVEDRLRGRGAGNDRHLAADVDQVPEDVPLHAEVEGDDVRAPGALPCSTRARLSVRGSSRTRDPVPAPRRTTRSGMTSAPGRGRRGRDLLRLSPPGWRRRGRSSTGRPSSPRGRASGAPAPGCRCLPCR